MQLKGPSDHTSPYSKYIFRAAAGSIAHIGIAPGLPRGTENHADIGGSNPVAGKLRAAVGGFIGIRAARWRIEAAQLLDGMVNSICPWSFGFEFNARAGAVSTGSAASGAAAN